jgi:hypothetical protein
MWEQLITNVSQRSIYGSSTEDLHHRAPVARRAGPVAVASKACERTVGNPQPSPVAKAEVDTWGTITATVRERKSMKGLRHRNSSPVVMRGARDNNTMREQHHTSNGLLHHSSLPLIARAGTEDTWSSIAESIRQRKSLRENRSWSRKEAVVTPA